MPPLAQLEYTTYVLRRAQYEAFAFSLTDEGILVRNESHANPGEHEYHVTVDDGLPVSCQCPADERFDHACKHRVAIAIRPTILETATAVERWERDCPNSTALS